MLDDDWHEMHAKMYPFVALGRRFVINAVFVLAKVLAGMSPSQQMA